MMKKGILYIIGALAMTSCSSDIPYEYPDNSSKEVCFSVGSVNTSEILSRAHDHSVEYDQAKHANHLVVFGYGDGSTGNVVFNNALLNYENGKWITDKYWAEIAAKYKTNDFIAYMVEDDADPVASVAADGSKYTLTFTPTLPALTNENSKWLFTGYNTPLICHAPVHKDVPANMEENTDMKFEMDQTLTGYTVWFQLGEKMDNVRDFVIRKVHINGTFPLSGTLSKSYTLSDDGSWTPEKEEATWSGISGTQTIEHDIPWGDNTLTISQGDKKNYKKWGNEKDPTSGAFFTIPFDPKDEEDTYNLNISVTYDVVLNDPDNDSDNNVVTRQNVTSTIAFNTANFGSSLKEGTTGTIHRIHIQIVPSYLYVLADKDQTTGYLVIDQK